MKRFFTLCVALMLALAVVAPAQAEFQDMWAYVYSWDGSMNGDGTMKLTRVTSGITFQVLQRNTDTEETLYYYDVGAMTSLTNPVSTSDFESATVCNDRVSFRVDPGETNDTYVDLIVVDTNGGYTAFVEDFTDEVHTIVIDERPNVMHSGCIWFNDNTTSEQDTGIDFDYDTNILIVMPEVVDTITGGTVDIGLLSTETSGDADGLVDGAATTTAGFPLLTTTTSGALMDNSTNFDADGHSVISSNAKSLTYTTNSNTDTDPVGYIHYQFCRMR